MATLKGGKDSTKLQLCTEWMELESDPGLFTLLIGDIGVKGVKVEEVYDVTQTFEDRVFGFVFLFQWIEERRARKKAMNDDCYVTEPSVLQKMFFAHQIVTNSCATHALLSILLNCDKDPDITLGPTLQDLKTYCQYLDPESRGYAIGNIPQLATAHNRHAKPDIPIQSLPPTKRGAVMTSASAFVPETYHFVSYVPIGERLFELDGLKEWPIDHGPWAETEDWTDLFKRVISRRLTEGEGIQFNLMALIPDPIPRLSQELKVLQSKQKVLLDQVFHLAQMRLTKVPDGIVIQNGDSSQHLDDRVGKLIHSVSQSIGSDKATLEALVNTPNEIEDKDLDTRLRIRTAEVILNNQSLEKCKKSFQEELDTRKRYELDSQRRTHNYDIFFNEYFKHLASHKMLPSRMLEMKRSGGKRGKKPAPKSKKLNHQKVKSQTNLLFDGPTTD